MSKTEILFARNGQIWATDGTLAGTGPVAAAASNLRQGTASDANGFTLLATGQIAYGQNDGGTSDVLVTGGTQASTSIVSAVAEQSYGIGLTHITAASAASNLTSDTPNLLLYEDGAPGGSGGQYALFRSDGTSAGTTVFANGTGYEFTPIGSNHAVFAYAPQGSSVAEPTVTDGSSAGTQILTTLAAGSSIDNFTALGAGKAAFTTTAPVSGGGSPGAVSPNYKNMLWVTDGTSAGTSQIASFSYSTVILSSTFTNTIPNGTLTPLGNGQAVFAESDLAHGLELWVTDGTSTGTALVSDIDPGPNPSNPTAITALGNGRAVFFATDGVNGSSLYVTDGTATGTQRLSGGGGTNFPNPYGLFADTSVLLPNGSLLYAAASSGLAGVFVSNGTAAGTGEVTPIGGSASQTQIYDFQVLPNGQAFFLVSGSYGGATPQLWVSDGTAAGTHQFDGLTATALSAGFTANTPLLPVPVNGTAALDLSSREFAQQNHSIAGVQIQPGTNEVQLLDGVITIGTNSNEAALERIFYGLLGHTPDQPSLGVADQLLQSGVTLAQVATDFLSFAPVSAQPDPAFVQSMFTGFLGRAGGTADIDAFTTLLASRASRGAVVAGLASSSESQAYYAGQTTGAFVSSTAAGIAYRSFYALFGTDQDSAGATFVTNELQAYLTPQQVAQQLLSVASAIGSAAVQTNANFVTTIYENGLGRAPSSAELQNDAALLQTGGITQAQLLSTVATSPESLLHLTGQITP